MDVYTQVAITIGSGFAVVAALLTGLVKIRALLASDVVAELAKCNEERSAQGKEILRLSIESSRQAAKIEALELIARVYLTPRTNGKRAADHDPHVKEALPP